MSWLKVTGSRGNWLKAKQGENHHGWQNKENEKPLETLLKLPNGEAATKKFFNPAQKMVSLPIMAGFLI